MEESRRGHTGSRFPLPAGERVHAVPGGRRIADRYRYADVLSAAAPSDDLYRYFDQDRKAAGKPGRPEEAIADWLKAPGRDMSVRSVDERSAGIQRPGRKIPDAVIDVAGVTVEFKTVESPPIRAIRDNIRRLGKESEHGIVDLRAAGVNKAMTREALVREIGHSGRRLAQIVVVLTEDEHLRMPQRALAPESM